MKKKKGGSTLPRKKKGFRSAFKSYWQLYVLVLPAVLYFLVFNYLPLYGIQIAFKDYKAVKGIAGSPWVGLKHFKNFFNAYYFDRLIINTLLLNILNLVFSFPVPLLLSILLNQIRKQKVKRAIQTTIYVPYFISTVVLAGMLYIFLSPTSGIFNHVRQAMGLNPIDYMSEAAAFRPIYIISNIWQTAGYSTILYIATLTGIDLSLYEAADIDGASTWTTYWKVVFPMMMPMHATVAILTALGTWNDVMTPLVIMSGTGQNTLPLAQLNFQTQFGTNYNLAFASYIMALIPILIFYVICQKQILNGVANGAVKG